MCYTEVSWHILSPSYTISWRTMMVFLHLFLYAILTPGEPVLYYNLSFSCYVQKHIDFYIVPNLLHFIFLIMYILLCSIMNWIHKTTYVHLCDFKNFGSIKPRVCYVGHKYAGRNSTYTLKWKLLFNFQIKNNSITLLLEACSLTWWKTSTAEVF